MQKGLLNNNPGRAGQLISEISAVLIVKDSEVSLARTLRALSVFAEVIVYDTGSQDASVSVAKKFPNVRVHQGYFDGFSTTRKRANAEASNDWIFSVDSDELCSADLICNLCSWAPKSDLEVGCAKRVNIFFGKKMRFGSMKATYQRILFNRARVNFGTHLVHEGLEALKPDEKITPRKLNGHIEHLDAGSMPARILKSQFYGELRAREMKKKLPVAYALLKTVFSFLKAYIWRLGVLEGWRGIADAWLAAYSVYYKHACSRSKFGIKSVPEESVRDN